MEIASSPLRNLLQCIFQVVNKLLSLVFSLARQKPVQLTLDIVISNEHILFTYFNS